MRRSRGGLTSKIHAVVDTNGLPVRVALTAGEAHDNRLAGRLLSRLKSGAMLLADRGYDADWIRTLAAEKGAWANIPPRCNRNDPICFSPYLYQPGISSAILESARLVSPRAFAPRCFSPAEGSVKLEGATGSETVVSKGVRMVAKKKFSNFAEICARYPSGPGLKMPGLLIPLPRALFLVHCR
jgi:hypothetical protein